MNRIDEHPLVNYHTHTWRCQHAGGAEEDYVRAAIDAGFVVLGFSDHTPWPYDSDFVSGMRMRLDQLEDYLDTVQGLREKYAGQILIPVGLECEAFPKYMGWLADLKARSLDYLILGNHYDLRDDADHDRFDDAGGFYFGRCTRPAHVRRYVYRRFDADCAAAARDICQAAVALDIPLEYNLLGIQYHARFEERNVLGYPCPRFWEIAAECGCRAIVGFDAHQPEHLRRRDLFENGLNFLWGLGIDTLYRLPGEGLY